MFNGVFVQATPKNMELLGKIERYVTYGTPSRKTIDELLQKRGSIFSQDSEESSKRIPLDDNDVIEKLFGDMGVLCLEDIVYELFKGNSEVAPKLAASLWNFQLSPPVNEVTKKKEMIFDSDNVNRKCPYSRGGVYGDRGSDINDIILKLL
jgi:large subunit ribosomal protein L7e